MIRRRSSSRWSRNDILPPVPDSGSWSSQSGSMSSLAAGFADLFGNGTNAMGCLRRRARGGRPADCRLFWRHFGRRIDLVGGGVGIPAGNRGVLFRLDFRAVLLDLFHADFLLQRAFQLVGGLPELTEALPQRTAELRELPRPKDDERDDHDDRQLHKAEGG